MKETNTRLVKVQKIIDAIKMVNDICINMNENIINNGYGSVDLDFPSGTLWAACNVGAKKPSDYGLYFQWGRYPRIYC